jgi:hypothetical protein
MDVLEELKVLISEIRFKIADVFQFGGKETIIYGAVKYNIVNPSPEEGKEKESRIIRFNSEIDQKTAERLEELGEEIKGMPPKQRLESAVASAVLSIEEVLREELKEEVSVKENVVVEIGDVLTSKPTAEEPTLTIDLKEESESSKSGNKSPAKKTRAKKARRPKKGP